MRLRTAYIVLSVPLIVWLLLANMELRYYRSTSVAYDVNAITTGLTTSVQNMDRALQSLGEPAPWTALDWLATVEQTLQGVQTASRSYNAALNRRFARTQGMFLDLGTAAAMYGQEIRSVRQYVERNGQFRPEDRALLSNVAADLRTLQGAIPEDLLKRARRDELAPLLGDLAKSLKVESIRGWFGAPFNSTSGMQGKFMQG